MIPTVGWRQLKCPVWPLITSSSQNASFKGKIPNLFMGNPLSVFWITHFSLACLSQFPGIMELRNCGCFADEPSYRGKTECIQRLSIKTMTCYFCVSMEIILPKLDRMNWKYNALKLRETSAIYIDKSIKHTNHKSPWANYRKLFKYILFYVYTITCHFTLQ